MLHLLVLHRPTCWTHQTVGAPAHGVGRGRQGSRVGARYCVVRSDTRGFGKAKGTCRAVQRVVAPGWQARAVAYGVCVSGTSTSLPSTAQARDACRMQDGDQHYVQQQLRGAARPKSAAGGCLATNTHTYFPLCAMTTASYTPWPRPSPDSAQPRSASACGARRQQGR